MRSKLIIFAIGLISGLSIWILSSHIKTVSHNRSLDEYLAYYDKNEFMQEDGQVLNLEALKKLTLIDTNYKATHVGVNSEKVIFLNLWATWSQPCMDQLRSIESLEKDLGDKVDFYLMSSESIDDLKRIKRRTHTKLSLYSYQSEELLPAYFQKGVIPFTVIMYKGVIWFEHMGTAPWDSDKVVQLVNTILD